MSTVKPVPVDPTQPIDNDVCSVSRTLDLIGDRWTVLVLRDAFWRVRRFDDFQRRLGIARNILSDRLRKLVDAGIMEKRVYQERPQRYEYRLTEAGKELMPVIVMIMQWGDKHLAGGVPPVVFRHKECGQITHAECTCAECGEPITAGSVRGEAGPGYVAAADAA
jgi:DNA-binding HxlR family transcriptional regulator